jgi:hypothetical protein
MGCFRAAQMHLAARVFENPGLEVGIESKRQHGSLKKKQW